MREDPQQPELEVTRLDPRDRRGIARASVTLARAFQFDPLFSYLFDDPMQRAERLPYVLGTLMRYTFAQGHVDLAPDFGAVACWLGPQDTRVSVPRSFLLSGARGGALLGPWRISELMRFNAMMREEHDRHMPYAEPHHYLYLLGAEPLRRGQGLGRRTMRPVLERADADQLPCYLETQNPENLRLYASVGFTLMNERPFTPDGRVTLYCLRREPEEAP